MDWKTMLAYITGSVDRELLLRNEYLVTENRILRDQLQGRLCLTDGERRTLAEIGKQLGKRALEEVASIVRPDTILGWHRRCCTARSKSLTSLCRLQSHPAQYVSGIPSAAILLSISHPIRCSTRCLANVRARISGPMIAL